MGFINTLAGLPSTLCHLCRFIHRIWLICKWHHTWVRLTTIIRHFMIPNRRWAEFLRHCCTATYLFSSQVLRLTQRNCLLVEATAELVNRGFWDKSSLGLFTSWRVGFTPAFGSKCQVHESTLLLRRCHLFLAIFSFTFLRCPCLLLVYWRSKRAETRASGIQCN